MTKAKQLNELVKMLITAKAESLKQVAENDENFETLTMVKDMGILSKEETYELNGAIVSCVIAGRLANAMAEAIETELCELEEAIMELEAE